ncbi:putative DNA binding protein [Xanthomonas phage FMYAK-P1]|uniref:DNA binding protein n=1 Tax=Xanthomonas phage FMYAK-P1 TaxID=2886031 RepID=A0AAE8YLN6_9CAUD|nr:putative DNA binding protein [Xanthomonas phage FMYAK-P1]UGL62786.1 putative DNA binding protein [Xanthomonas phage FMYAK-P1]
MAAAKQNDRKVTSPKFRASFAWIFKPQPPMEGSTGEAKYGVTMLFDAAARKTAQYDAMQKLAHAAAKEKFGDKLKPDGKGWYHGLRNPFRDGAEKSELEGYEGMVFVAATTKMQPGCVDQQLNRLISDEVSEDGFYSGCYARATLTAYGYDKAGNKGVAFGLQNVQKLGDGAAFSGRTAAENDFDSVDDFVGEGEQSSGGGSFLD